MEINIYINIKLQEKHTDVSIYYAYIHWPLFTRGEKMDNEKSNSVSDSEHYDVFDTNMYVLRKLWEMFVSVDRAILTMLWM